MSATSLDTSKQLTFSFNAPGNFQPDLFYQICVHGTLEQLKSAIEKGADVNTIFKDSKTPLHLVAINNLDDEAFDKCEVLINAGADITKTDNSSSTPLLYACKDNKIETMKLLATPETLNIKNSEGENAFDLIGYYSNANRTEAYRALIDTALSFGGATEIKESNNSSKPATGYTYN